MCAGCCVDRVCGIVCADSQPQFLVRLVVFVVKSKAACKAHANAWNKQKKNETEQKAKSETSKRTKHKQINTNTSTNEHN